LTLTYSPHIGVAGNMYRISTFWDILFRG